MRDDLMVVTFPESRRSHQVAPGPHRALRMFPMSSNAKPRSAMNLTAAVLLVVGTALALFALLADRLHVGGGEGFGYQQMIVLIIGIVLMLGGLRMVFAPWINRLGSSDPAGS